MCYLLPDKLEDKPEHQLKVRIWKRLWLPVLRFKHSFFVRLCHRMYTVRLLCKPPSKQVHKQTQE